jgi:adenylylsulfate kinase-like enzyme
VSEYVVWHNATVTRARREPLNGHRRAVLSFTGLSGTGNSTLARLAEDRLFRLGCRTFAFDGDTDRETVKLSIEADLQALADRGVIDACVHKGE